MSSLLPLGACRPGATIYPPAQESAAGLYSYLTNTDPDFSSLVWLGDQILTSSANGDIWRSGDGGKSWSFDYSFPGRSIASMITDGKHIWAVGSRGEIFTSADAGATWHKSISGTDANLTSVVLTPGHHDLWVTGQSGTVLFSSGDGEEWSSKKTGDSNNLTDIWAASDLRHIWACGAKGTILRSVDGGKNWNRLVSNTRKDLASIAGNEDGSLLLVAGAPYTTMWSDDEGDSWHTVNLPEESQITRIRYNHSEKRFYLSGLDGFLATTANGRDFRMEDTSTNRALLGMNLERSTPWAIGRAGTLLHKENGRWMPSDKTSAMFIGLHDLNATEFVEFGDAGYVGICAKDKPAGPCKLSPVGTNKDIYCSTSTSTDGRLWVAGSHGLLAVREKEAWRIVPMDEKLNIQDMVWNDPYLFIATYGSTTGNGNLAPEIKRSSDGGRSWETVLTTDKPLRTIVMHGLHGAAGGEKGAVFLTDDGGKKWTGTVTGNPSAVYTIQREGGITAALGANGDLMVLEERTQSWQNEGTNGDSASFFASYCLDSCKTIVAVGSGGSVAISTNHGGSFDSLKVTTGPMEGIVPLGGKRAIVLTNRNETREIEDVTAEWWDDALNTPYSEDVTDWALLLDPSKSRMLVAGANGRLVLSENGGLHPQKVTPDGLGNDLMALARSADGMSIVAVGGGGTVLRSSDGRKWNRDPLTKIKGIPMTDTLYTVVNCEGKFWAAGRGGEMFVEEIANGPWRAIAPLEDAPETISELACAGTAIWAARMDGTVAKFDTRTNEWQRPSQSISGDSLVSIGAASETPEEMAVLTTGGMLFLTKDSWSNFSSHYMGEKGYDVVISPDGNAVWAVGANGRITRSNDGGLSWTDNRGPTSADLHSISMNDYNVFITGDDSTVFWGRPNSSPPTLSSRHLDPGKINPTRWTARFSFAVPSRTEAQNVSGIIGTAGEVQTATLRGATADFASNGQYVTLSTKKENFFDGQQHTLEFKPPILKGTGEIVLQLCIDDSSTGKTCWPFAIQPPPTFLSSPAGYGALSFAGVLAATILVFFFRPITFIQIYQAQYLSAVLEFKIAGFEVFRPLITLIALPYLAFHRRSLEAWFARYSHNLRTATFKQEMMTLGGEYIPLPTRVASSKSDTVLLRPTDDVLLKLLRPEGTIVQITGPGGIGKTSLCKHLCQLFLDEEKLASNSCPYPLILDREFTDLASTVQQRLGVVSGVKVGSDLAAALLREGIVLVVIDGVSEKSDTVRAAMVAAIGSASIRQVIVTSRTALAELGGRGVQCEPQPLATDNLLFFIGKLVSDARAERGESIDAEQQLVIATKISKMIRKGGETLALTPLLAKLIVEKALRTRSLDPNFAEVPATVPEAYLEYIRFVGSKSNDLTAQDQVLRVAMIVAKSALGEDLVAAKVRTTLALGLIGQDSIANGESLLEVLRDAGVIATSVMQGYTYVAYVLDPLAEYLAAYSWAEDIRKDSTVLQGLEKRFAEPGFKGDGFRTALQLILQTPS